VKRQRAKAKIVPQLMSNAIRTCLGCGSKKNKLELARFVADDQGKLVQDIDYHLTGRGAYTCRSSDCLKRFLQNTKRLHRAFRKQNLSVGKDLFAIFGVKNE